MTLGTVLGEHLTMAASLEMFVSQLTIRIKQM